MFSTSFGRLPIDSAVEVESVCYMAYVQLPKLANDLGCWVASFSHVCMLLAPSGICAFPHAQSGLQVEPASQTRYLQREPFAEEASC